MSSSGMSGSGKGPSRRFRSSSWTERLVPLVLVLLLLLLVGTISLVLISMLGVMP